MYICDRQPQGGRRRDGTRTRVRGQRPNQIRPLPLWVATVLEFDAAVATVELTATAAGESNGYVRPDVPRVRLGTGYRGPSTGALTLYHTWPTIDVLLSQNSHK